MPYSVFYVRTPKRRSGQLGAPANFRDVHIQVYGQPQSWSFFGTISDAVQEALNNAGWAISRVAPAGTGIGCTNYGCTLDIYAVVSNLFDQAAIEQQLPQDLAGVFSVTNISIISGGASPGVPAGGSGLIYDGGNLATVTVHTGDTTNTGASGLPSVNSPGGGSNSLFGSLGSVDLSSLGLGVVGGGVIVGGLLLLVALKK
jgi:hypothetical protein